MQPIIATGHKTVTETAKEILQQGGNAFDAAVAAAFVSVMAEPALTSLGGGGFLIAKPASGQIKLYDFFVNTPGKGQYNSKSEPHFLPITVYFPSCEQIFNVGHASVAVPGMLRGLLTTHRELGRLPLKDILSPAIKVAREGVSLNKIQAYVLGLLQPIMTLTTAGQRLFYENDKFLKEGALYKNADLTSFLETLPIDGDKEFYEGEIARKIVRDMEDHGGLLTFNDLSSYQVVKRRPLFQKYRRYQLLSNPLPSFGGTLLTHALNLLEHSGERIPEFGCMRHLAGLVTLMQQAERHRAEGLFEQTFSEENITLSVAEIRKAFGGTTHISIIDSEGNAAGLSSSNGEGSGYIVPGTGVMLNNMMGEDDLHPEGFHSSPPGLRVGSMMSPSILMKDNQVEMVIGSGGSKRIAMAILQVLLNRIEFGMNMKDAVESPRLHWDGSEVQIEPGFDETVLAQLKELWPLNIWQVKDVYFGGVHAVSVNGESAGDSRRGGSAVSDR